MNWERVGKTRVFVCEHHHQVLQAWVCAWRTVNKPLVLVTMDSHTDLLLALSGWVANTEGISFSSAPHQIQSRRAELLSQVDLNSDESIDWLLSCLRHDEHIDCAQRLGIIERAFVILNYDSLGDHGHSWVDIIRPDERGIEYSAYANNVIESDRIDWCRERIENLLGCRIEDREYILDIDLDFFKSTQAAEPDDPQSFMMLIRHAYAVTIARESGHVLAGALPDEHVSSDELERAIRGHIEAAGCFCDDSG